MEANSSNKETNDVNASEGSWSGSSQTAAACFCFMCCRPVTGNCQPTLDMLSTVVSQVSVREKVEHETGWHLSSVNQLPTGVCSQCFNFVNEIDVMEHKLNLYRNILRSNVQASLNSFREGKVHFNKHSTEVKLDSLPVENRQDSVVNGNNFIAVDDFERDSASPKLKLSDKVMDTLSGSSSTAQPSSLCTQVSLASVPLQLSPIPLTSKASSVNISIPSSLDRISGNDSLKNTQSSISQPHSSLESFGNCNMHDQEQPFNLSVCSTSNMTQSYCTLTQSVSKDAASSYLAQKSVNSDLNMGKSLSSQHDNSPITSGNLLAFELCSVSTKKGPVDAVQRCSLGNRTDLATSNGGLEATINSFKVDDSPQSTTTTQSNLAFSSTSVTPPSSRYRENASASSPTNTIQKVSTAVTTRNVYASISGQVNSSFVSDSTQNNNGQKLASSQASLLSSGVSNSPLHSSIAALSSRELPINSFSENLNTSIDGSHVPSYSSYTKNDDVKFEATVKSGKGRKRASDTSTSEIVPSSLVTAVEVADQISQTLSPIRSCCEQSSRVCATTCVFNSPNDDSLDSSMNNSFLSANCPISFSLLSPSLPAAPPHASLLSPESHTVSCTSPTFLLSLHQSALDVNLFSYPCDKNEFKIKDDSCSESSDEVLSVDDEVPQIGMSPHSVASCPSGSKEVGTSKVKFEARPENQVDVTQNVKNDLKITDNDSFKNGHFSILTSIGDDVNSLCEDVVKQHLSNEKRIDDSKYKVNAPNAVDEVHECAVITDSSVPTGHRQILPSVSGEHSNKDGKHYEKNYAKAFDSHGYDLSMNSIRSTTYPVSEGIEILGSPTNASNKFSNPVVGCTRSHLNTHVYSSQLFRKFPSSETRKTEEMLSTEVLTPSELFLSSITSENDRNEQKSGSICSANVVSCENPSNLNKRVSDNVLEASKDSLINPTRSLNLELAHLESHSSFSSSHPNAPQCSSHPSIRPLHCMSSNFLTGFNKADRNQSQFPISLDGALPIASIFNSKPSFRSNELLRAPDHVNNSKFSDVSGAKISSPLCSPTYSHFTAGIVASSVASTSNELLPCNQFTVDSSHRHFSPNNRSGFSRSNRESSCSFFDSSLVLTASIKSSLESEKSAGAKIGITIPISTQCSNHSSSKDQFGVTSCASNISIPLVTKLSVNGHSNENENLTLNRCMANKQKRESSLHENDSFDPIADAQTSVMVLDATKDGDNVHHNLQSNVSVSKQGRVVQSKHTIGRSRYSKRKSKKTKTKRLNSTKSYKPATKKSKKRFINSDKPSLNSSPGYSMTGFDQVPGNKKTGTTSSSDVLAPVKEASKSVESSDGMELILAGPFDDTNSSEITGGQNSFTKLPGIFDQKFEQSNLKQESSEDGISSTLTNFSKDDHTANGAATNVEVLSKEEESETRKLPISEACCMTSQTLTSLNSSTSACSPCIVPSSAMKSCSTLGDSSSFIIESKQCSSRSKSCGNIANDSSSSSAQSANNKTNTLTQLDGGETFNISTEFFAQIVASPNDNGANFSIDDIPLNGPLGISSSCDRSTICNSADSLIPDLMPNKVVESRSQNMYQNTAKIHSTDFSGSMAPKAKEIVNLHYPCEMTPSSHVHITSTHYGSSNIKQSSDGVVVRTDASNTFHVTSPDRVIQAQCALDSRNVNVFQPSSKSNSCNTQRYFSSEGSTSGQDSTHATRLQYEFEGAIASCSKSVLAQSNFPQSNSQMMCHTNQVFTGGVKQMLSVSKVRSSLGHSQVSCSSTQTQAMIGQIMEHSFDIKRANSLIHRSNTVPYVIPAASRCDSVINKKPQIWTNASPQNNPTVQQFESLKNEATYYLKNDAQHASVTNHPNHGNEVQDIQLNHQFQNPCNFSIYEEMQHPCVPVVPGNNSNFVNYLHSNSSIHNCGKNQMNDNRNFSSVYNTQQHGHHLSQQGSVITGASQQANACATNAYFQHPNGHVRYPPLKMNQSANSCGSTSNVLHNSSDTVAVNDFSMLEQEHSMLLTSNLSTQPNNHASSSGVNYASNQNANGNSEATFQSGSKIRVPGMNSLPAANVKTLNPTHCSSSSFELPLDASANHCVANYDATNPHRYFANPNRMRSHVVANELSNCQAMCNTNEVANSVLPSLPYGINVQHGVSNGSMHFPSVQVHHNALPQPSSAVYSDGHGQQNVNVMPPQQMHYLPVPSGHTYCDVSCIHSCMSYQYSDYARNKHSHSLPEYIGPPNIAEVPGQQQVFHETINHSYSTSVVPPVTSSCFNSAGLYTSVKKFDSPNSLHSNQSSSCSIEVTERNKKCSNSHIALLKNQILSTEPDVLEKSAVYDNNAQKIATGYHVAEINPTHLAVPASTMNVENPNLEMAEANPTSASRNLKKDRFGNENLQPSMTVAKCDVTEASTCSNNVDTPKFNQTSRHPCENDSSYNLNDSQPKVSLSRDVMTQHDSSLNTNNYSLTKFTNNSTVNSEITVDESNYIVRTSAESPILNCTNPCSVVSSCKTTTEMDIDIEECDFPDDHLLVLDNKSDYKSSQTMSSDFENQDPAEIAPNPDPQDVVKLSVSGADDFSKNLGNAQTDGCPDAVNSEFVEEPEERSLNRPSTPELLRNVQEATEYHKPTLLTRNLKMKKHAKLQICRQCDQVFSTRNCLVRHIERRHKISMMHFNCPNCAKKCNSERSLNRHMLQHKNFTCKLCHETFSSRTDFKKHIDQHSRGSLSCTSCNKDCSTIQALISHMNTHTKDKPNYLCTTCQKEFANKRNLIVHIRTHTGERPHKCSNCRKTFSVRSNMLAHEEMCLDKCRFKCDLCSRGFPLESVYKRHLEEHEGKFAYTCTVCQKGFSKPSGLKAHSRTHELVQQFPTNHSNPVKTQQKQKDRKTKKSSKCPVCGKQLSRHQLLKDHLARHANERNHKCPDCDQVFFYKSNIRSHQLAQHSNVKKFACPDCSKSFASKNSLNIHLTVHSGVKPHQCHVCGKAFSIRSNYTRHLKCHATPSINSIPAKLF